MRRASPQSLRTIFGLLEHVGAVSTGKSASILLSLGHCIVNRLPFDALDVEAAHVAGADVVRLDEVTQLVGEELGDDLVVGDGAAIDSQLEPLELALSPV